MQTNPTPRSAPPSLDDHHRAVLDDIHDTLGADVPELVYVVRGSHVRTGRPVVADGARRASKPGDGYHVVVAFTTASTTTALRSLAGPFPDYAVGDAAWLSVASSLASARRAAFIPLSPPPRPAKGRPAPDEVF